MPIADQTSTLVARIAYARLRRKRERTAIPNPAQGCPELLLGYNTTLYLALGKYGTLRLADLEGHFTGTQIFNRNRDDKCGLLADWVLTRKPGQYSPGKGIGLDAGFPLYGTVPPFLRSLAKTVDFTIEPTISKKKRRPRVRRNTTSTFCSARCCVSSSEGFVTDATRSTLAGRRCGVVTIVKSYNTALSWGDLAINNVIEEFRALITVARAKRISSAARGFLETGLFDF
jgi:hypothetical protein